ncbi:PEP-CTERM sorting domain-containing protein [Dendronalium sp. ChiSLP03b]|uniref:PEP-CTERM sorting domain-containing protein n=1 Tax=Dendronalium sp. ChiSLP03b TaxID=3075381 RepID=UPI002AD58B3D|nr:PEP-CTERM sorting domain-containing protein [Dendronalium sp. ChiSLP03b]MDZ8207260.1 PEP-CTERM sorting domain-containing protein [Dendronalium sp. ChiSLP03b]
MKLVPKLLLAAASVTLYFTTVDAKSAFAGIVNYAFTVNSPTTEGNGFFSFDDSTFSDESIPVAIVKSLSFKFEGDSTVYTEEDDINYPEFPLVFSTDFLTGQTSFALDYLFKDKANPANSISYEIIGEDFTIFSSTSPNSEVISGTVSYQKVPEPMSLAGTLIACSLGWTIAKKTTSMKKVKV